MKVEELLKPYGNLLGEEVISKKLTELAVNCISLVETWLSKTDSKSFKIEKNNHNGDIIQTLFGVTPDNITSEVFKICFEKPAEVASIKVYSLNKADTRIECKQIGALDIV